ncbi:MAG: stage III sporulation protein AF [Bacillota bacterium]
MGILMSIVKSLLLIVVIASFLEILLPDNSLRPFVRFTIGLFVILAILNPILSTFYSERALQASAWDLPWEYNETGRYRETGIEVNRDIQKVGSEVIKEKIEQQINSLAILVPGVGDLETRVVIDPQTGELSEVALAVVPMSTDSGDGTIEAF